MCKTPKMPKPSAEDDKAPILLTRSDTLGNGVSAAKRRKNQVRLDLNNATAAYQGLTIPNG